MAYVPETSWGDAEQSMDPNFTSYEDSLGGYQPQQSTANIQEYNPWDDINLRDENFSGTNLGQSQINTGNYNPFDSNAPVGTSSPSWMDGVMPPTPVQGQFGNGGSDNSIQSYLKELFTGKNGVKNSVTGIGGLLSTFQQMQANSQNKALGNQMLQKMDPFGSQRGQYQQLLSQSYTNPNSVLDMPEIQGQLSQMRKAIEAKDAAGGRRSQYGSREVQLAEQAAKLLQGYRNQLMQPAGAGINPNAGTGAQILQQVNGANSSSINPLMTAAGKIFGGDSTDSLLQQLVSRMKG